MSKYFTLFKGRVGVRLWLNPRFWQFGGYKDISGRRLFELGPVTIEALTWNAHTQIPDISRTWYNGCSIICDSSPDRKWLGALYEVLKGDFAHKAHSLEEVEIIVKGD